MEVLAKSLLNFVSSNFLRSFGARSHEASLGCEICGVSYGISHYLLICDDDCCSRLDLVSELLSKFGVETDSGSQLLGFNRPALTGHTHPSAGLPSGRELTRFASAAFE